MKPSQRQLNAVKRVERLKARGNPVSMETWLKQYRCVCRNPLVFSRPATAADELKEMDK